MRIKLDNNWQFPNEDHVKKVCRSKQGKRTCRYLSLSTVSHCEKGSFIGELANSRVKEGVMKARGDNCDGILEFLCDGRLAGKEVISEKKSPPYYKIKGTVRKLVVKDGMLVLDLVLDAEWEDRDEYTCTVTLGHLFVTGYREKITIDCSSPIKSTWTFFKKSKKRRRRIFEVHRPQFL